MREADGLLPVFPGGFLADSHSGTRELPGNDLNASGITERLEELLAIFPGQAEGADIGEAETGDDIADLLTILRCELSAHHRPLRPIHKFGE